MAYKSTDEKSRFGVFRDNMIKARKLQDNELGDATYGASPFADLSGEHCIVREKHM